MTTNILQTTAEKVFQSLHPSTTTIQTKKQLVTTILLFRFFYWFCMALSCWMIPTHNPGDDVLRFGLRFTTAEAPPGSTTPNAACFCAEGHICDHRKPKTTVIGNNTDHDTTIVRCGNEVDDHCARYNEDTGGSNPFFGASLEYWDFWLSPLTKWDAARFLHLAVRPSLRDPSSPRHNTTKAASTSTRSLFEASEQAHAFLPMVPLIFGTLAKGAWKISQKLIPNYISFFLLPPTFEGIVVLSGFVWNNIVCVILSTVALYHLTLEILPKNNINQNSNHKVAVAACLVYGIWNPALVFFVTNYSESFFATCTIVGHWLFIKILQQSRQNATTTRSKDNANGSEPNSTTTLLKALVMSIPIWMMATYTRSNGTIHSLWLFYYGVALFLYHCNGNKQQPQRQKQKLLVGTIQFLLCVIGAILVALPFRYHDWQGYQRHCNVTKEESPRPDWCLDESSSSYYFSLYAWTQRRHWNVGLFHYYQWKQIPNFLLAAPILGLSTYGVLYWIYYSWIVDYGKGKIPSMKTTAKTKTSMVFCFFFQWPIRALIDSVSCNKSVHTKKNNGDDDNAIPTIVTTNSPARQPQTTTTGNSKATNENSSKHYLIHNPLLLGHYAILAFLVLVGTLIAHVQISTRMICSSSPAIIWFLTYCHLDTATTTTAKDNATATTMSWKSIFVTAYTLLFMLLGIILHVNFLPWT